MTVEIFLSASLLVSPSAALSWTTSWQGFTEFLSEPRLSPCSRGTCTQALCPYKRGACWAPILYVDAELVAITMLVFDVDQVTDDQLDEIRDRIGGLRYLVHSTHSDRPDRRCLRLVFPLSRSVTRDEWTSFWRAAYLSLSPIADPACADAARRYLRPSCPYDASYFIQVNEGMVLDVDAVMEMGTSSQAPTISSASAAEGKREP